MDVCWDFDFAYFVTHYWYLMERINSSIYLSYKYPLNRYTTYSQIAFKIFEE